MNTYCILFLLASGAVLGQTLPPAAQPAKPPSPLAEMNRAMEDLARRVAPSVVQIMVSGFGPLEESGGNVGLVARHRATGSGVIVDPAGYIVTNAHVLESARRVRVMLSSPMNQPSDLSAGRARSNPIDAKIVGVDKESDIAVIKVDRTGLPALRFALAEHLRQGQMVLAIGSPLGLQNTLTMGIVSSTARQIKPDDTMAYIQTDAAINPGNSGGALVDIDGRLLGINTFILSQGGGNEGLGFAIPAPIVRSIYRQIRKNGHVHRGEIGAVVQTITPVLAAGLGLLQDWGAIVTEVSKGGPADQAGLKYKDILVAINGRAIQNARQLEWNLFRSGTGEVVKLDILRDGQKQSIPVTVLERTDYADKLLAKVDVEKNIVPKLGLFCIEIDKDIAPLMPSLRAHYGVVVAGKTASTAGQEVPLELGDVIHSLNGQLITTLDDLRKLADALKPGDPVVLEVERPAGMTFVAFEWE